MSKLDQLLADFDHNLPHFPDGRIDYSQADSAAVVTVFVSFKSHILLLKRSNNVREYKGKWHTVAGYMDEIVSVREKVLEELREEIGVGEELISDLKIGDCYKFIDLNLGKTWYVNPVLVTLHKKPAIKLDHEHTDFVWLDKPDFGSYECVPSLVESWQRVWSI